jgi:hypothetical protein
LVSRTYTWFCTAAGAYFILAGAEIFQAFLCSLDFLLHFCIKTKVEKPILAEYFDFTISSK